MIRTCTAFHHFLARHGIDPSQVTLVVRASGPMLKNLIETRMMQELDTVDGSIGFYDSPKRRTNKIAGINLVITTLDESARVK